MKRILFTLCAFFVSTLTCYGATNLLQECLNKIVAEPELWQDRLFDKTNGIFKDVDDNETITNTMVQRKKNNIYTLLAANVVAQCSQDLGRILKENERAKIKFEHNGTPYVINFDVKTMVDYMSIRTGILVSNKKDLAPGDVFELSSIPKKEKIFPDQCSDWVIWDNLDDTAAVNKTGQKVFSDAIYGGRKNEFFLDFADGDNMRAFPGLVLMDKTWSTTEKIVTYNNLNTGIEKTQSFAQGLRGTACQGLAVYSVILDVKRDNSRWNKTGWAIGASVGGGAFAWVGISAAAAATGSTAVTGGIASAMLSTAAGASAVPVWGWIAAGVLVAAATVVSLYPAEIEKLEQVMILDGPYIVQ